MGSSADESGPGRTVPESGPGICSDTEHGVLRERGTGSTGASPSEATERGITKAPPPPKHKNNPALDSRGFAGFSSLDLDESDAADAATEREIERECRELADALLDLSGESALNRVRRVRTLFLDEHQSQLGRLPHIEAVLRRIQCGEPGAVLLDGKSYLLSEAAHGEELAMARQIRRIGREES